MMISGFVTIIVIEGSYVRQKKISFGPKCHGCVFFGSVFFRSQSNPPPASSSSTRSFRFRRFRPLIMFGSYPQGRWMPSSITEEYVMKLREARYLTGEIPHRLPAQGQVIPL